MSEIAAKVDQDSRPASQLLNLVTLAIRSFIAAAIVTGGICLSDPTGTSDALGKLGLLTPGTIISLLGDATVGCQPAPTPPPFIPCATTDSPGKICVPGPEDLKRREALISRKCTTPIINGWPATGNWLSRITDSRWAGILGFFVAATDVAVHLLVPTTVTETSKGARAIVGFVGLLQMLFGLGIAVVILNPVSRGLDGVWFAALVVLGTLLAGSAVAWAVLPAITFLFNEMVSLKAGLSASFIGVIAATYASGIAIIKYFLKKPFHGMLDTATDSVADRAARWFIRYVP
jgi:hypothetical protein